MQPTLSTFEKVDLLATKGIYVTYDVELDSHVTYNIEAKFEGEVVLTINSTDLEAGMVTVTNELMEHEIFEYAATNNREGYILAKDLNEASWKLTFNKGIVAKEIIGVSKVTFVSDLALAYVTSPLVALFK